MGHCRVTVTGGKLNPPPELALESKASKAGEGGGGRTLTFGIRKPATKLKDAAAFANPNIVLKGGKPILTGAAPSGDFGHSGST